MKVRHLEIHNFRGIKALDWSPDPGFNLLLGSGDSCKTTIIDAIDFVLGAKWSLTFTDADFYSADTSKNILIRATVGELPKNLKADLRFETSFRGWHEGVIHDEPRDADDTSDELVLTLQLEVDHTLEPNWTVWTEREVETHPNFRSQDREALGVIRVGAYVDRHLSWGRGSALDRYSSNEDELGPIFAKVRRETQGAFDQQELKSLRAIATNLGTEAQSNGVQFNDKLKPGLEITALQSSASAVTLFDGNVPSKQMGLGSRRLLVTTMQLQRESEKSVLLVDEIETALEPHRVRKLVQTLISSELQVIVTSHSPIAVQEASAQSVYIVQKSADTVVVKPMPDAIRSNLKKSPYAVLAKKVLVCEGKTEQGFIAACRELWETKHGQSLDALGIAEAYGEGQPNGGKLALAFAEFGFATSFFYDADRGAGFTPDRASRAGLTTFPHEDGTNSEIALFNSLTDDQINLMLEIVRLNRVGNMRSILDHFFVMPTDSSILWDATVKARDEITDRKDLLVSLAKGNDAQKPMFPGCPHYWGAWVKDTEIARDILVSCVADWEPFSKTTLGSLLERIRVWCYGK